MGIEVWKHREFAAGFLNSSSDDQATATDEERVSRKDQYLSIPQFRIAMLHYGSLGICLALDQDEDVPRRFCDDVARVMAADLQSLKFKIVEWPMLDTSGIDQSLKAARQVVTQRFLAMPDKVIVIGAEIRDYFQPIEDIGDETLSIVGKQEYLMLPSLRALFGSVNKKRLLMSLLYNWR